MIRRLLIFFMIMLSLVLLSACGQSEPTLTQGKTVEVEGSLYRDITPVEAKKMLDNKGFLLINVHVPYAGEIPTTDLFIPYNEIDQNLSQLPEDKGAKLMIYCRSGSMSTAAARTLVQLGFTNIWNIDSGMRGWEGEGFELIRTPQ